MNSIRGAVTTRPIAATTTFSLRRARSGTFEFDFTGESGGKRDGVLFGDADIKVALREKPGKADHS